MQCPRCGHFNEEGSLFCENCGLKLVQLKKDEDELDVPSIFHEPVEYTGRYSGIERPKKRRRVMRMTKKWLLAGVALLLLFGVYVTASQFSRVSEQMPEVIQTYAAAVRANDREILQKIIVSSDGKTTPNPDSYDGFMKLITIPGRLDESVRNLEVDFSHLLNDKEYRSQLSIKLIPIELDGQTQYKIGIDTFDIDVRNSGATLDGIRADADGFFKDYLMGQYDVAYGANRFPLTVDRTHPNLEGGVITPSRLADLEAPVVEEASEPVQLTPGTSTLRIITNVPKAVLRRNGVNTGIQLKGEEDTVQVDEGDKIQLLLVWEGGVAASQEIEFTGQEEAELPIQLNSSEFQLMIFERVKAMLIEDQRAMEERNRDGFTAVTGDALDHAVHVINRLYEGNQYYAGSYDWVKFDPSSFTLNLDGDAPKVSVNGIVRYVYQTYDTDAEPIDVDSLWRDEVPMSFDLVFDESQSQWMIEQWGRTETSINQDNLVEIIIQ